MQPFKTLLRAASDEYNIQKSRFIGYAQPVQTADDALALIQRIRQEHKTANHHCYAYIIGQNAGIMRYSDDGEPSGTAGLPIIEVLKARNVVDCVIVVTRYFGGVLLGAGGLVRAYSHTCALALDAAKVCEMLPTQRWCMEVEYPLWDKLLHALKALPARVENPQFSATVNFELVCRSVDSDPVITQLLQVTDGKLERLLTEETYAPWEDTAVVEGNAYGLV